ncbi:MAG: DNA polymerase III subunit delta [Prevotella sp.]|nr:DNA polymerase III subunit delta [Prevotella sp.]
MVEKKSGHTFEGIMKSLKAREYAPIYILMGEEAYFIDRISDFIAENVLTEEERDFNQMTLFGSDITGAQLVDMAKRYPMMAERQVLIVKEAQNIRSWDAIEKYVETPMPTTVLVICYKNGTIDKRKKIVAKAEAKGIVFESKKKRDSELPSFIEGYLRQRQIAIDNKSTQMIAESIGSDLHRLTSELDKLAISLPPQTKQITPEMVERQIGVSKEFNGFELKAAIIRRDAFKANQIIKYFDNNPKSGSIFAFLPLLFSYFQNLMIAYYAPNRTNEAELAHFLEMKSAWGARDYMTGMHNFSASKTLQIISKMREIDAKSKGLDNPNTSVGDLMKELVFFILH